MYNNPMLTDQELQLIYRSPEPDAGLVEKLSDGENLGDHARVSAFAMYYSRRIRNGGMLMEEEVRELVEYYTIEGFDGAAQSAVGDCAIFDLLTVPQCEYLLSILKDYEWARRQLLARLVLLDDISDIPAVVEQLIKLKSVWGILEILPTVSSGTLNAIRLRMLDTSVFNRGNRHVVREAVDKILREDAGKR
ncbi:MAG: hypothetical protein JWQ98_29 [Chlorobi bacterium]|nr:hypothetical protein [Chlorobiota bacterium]